MPGQTRGNRICGREDGVRNDVIMSICMNITLLVALAVLLTKLEFVQEILLNVERPEEEESRSRQLKNQLFLGLIFGVFCIISDYIGMQFHRSQ